MYRFDKEASEWKERGTGDLKLLKNKLTGQIRVLMRREKTHKICANHLVVKGMELKASVGSDKSWIYQTVADYSEGEARPETITVRFANPENAQEFKKNFEAAIESNEKIAAEKKLSTEGDALAEKVSDLKIKEKEEEKACTKDQSEA